MSLHTIRRQPQRVTTWLAHVALLLLLPASALAQKITYPGSIAEDTVTWRGLRWRDIGIFRGGRSIAAAGSAKRPFEFWMGTTGGGVFKTSDGGNTWGPASDGYFGGTIGSIAVSESDPDVVYVGTGEHAIRGNVSHGDGVFKTTDDGKTWSYVGLAATQQIARVRIHPTNPDIVWVAAFGHVYGPNSDRGVYKTRPMAARTGARCSSATIPPAPRISCSIRPTRTSSTRRSGRRIASRGFSPPAARGRASTRAPTVASTGRSSLTTRVSLTECSGALASRSRARSHRSCGRSLKRIPAVSIAPTTRARRGGSSTAIIASVSAPGITRGSWPIRSTRTSSTRRTSRS